MPRKTFTGCWTCRSRKLKCDEAQPHCRQCMSKNLVCEGYSVRLQWLPQETGVAGGGGPATRTVMSQRRQISFNIPSAAIEDAQLDSMLAQVDDDTARGWETTQHGPFRVFAADERAEWGGSVVEAGGPSETADLGQLVADLAQLTQPDSNALDGLHSWLSPPQGTDFEPIVWNSLGSNWVCQADQVVGEGGVEGQEVIGMGSENADDNDVDHTALPSPSPSSSPSLSHSHSTSPAPAPSRPHCPSLAASPSPSTSLPLSASRSPPPYDPACRPIPSIVPPVVNLFCARPEMRFLLRHYVEDVIDSFCVATRSTHHSPWKSIHLPRALQGSGELGLMGETSHARSALLYALLAVSAYCLANKYDDTKHQGQWQDQARRWRRVGSQLRLQVLSSLQLGLAEIMGGCERDAGGRRGSARQRRGSVRTAKLASSASALSTSSRSVSTPASTSQTAPAASRYKDLMAAILSTVTVDVASGDTSTTRMHLLGCESLMRKVRPRKLRYSHKALSLHRIFYYLSVIYEASNLDAGSALAPATTRSWLEETLCEEMRETQEARRKNPKVAVMPSPCEMIYGVPASLLILLRRVIDVVRERPEKSDTNVVAALEAEILDYPLDDILAASLGSKDGSIDDDDDSKVDDDGNDDDGDNEDNDNQDEEHDLIRYQSRAFYQSLIIYFGQNVRSMHSRYLQPYVHTVIDCAEAVEAMKSRNNLGFGALYWPCFIAATEAVDEGLQRRFLRWFQNTNGGSFAGCLRGRDVVMEVWRQRREGGQVGGAAWRDVVAAQKMCLMLT